MQLRQTETENAVSTAVICTVGLLCAVKWQERIRETLGVRKGNPDGNLSIRPVLWAQGAEVRFLRRF
jgi:hypothetical protein